MTGISGGMNRNTIKLSNMNFVDELKWRGMIHDIMPGTEELLAKGQTTAYVGPDSRFFACRTFGVGHDDETFSDGRT